MSKVSSNLSDRIFVTVDYWDGSAYIAELDQSIGADGKLQQQKLVVLCPEELANLTIALKRANITEV